MTPRWLRLRRALWALTLLALPVTSFRYYPPVFGSGTSKPLAFGPALLVVLVALLAEPAWAWRRVRTAVPVALAVWLLAALGSTGWALLSPPPPVSGFSLLARAARAWLSWAVGLTFLAAALLALRTRQDLTFTLRWLFVGFGVAALWGSLQLASLVVGFPPRAWLAQAQTWFSLRPWGQPRVQGLAFEPSWFADQLAVLYAMWLAAGWLTGYTRPWKGRGRRLALTLWAAVLLVWTYSRSGVLVALVALAAVGLRAGWRGLRRGRALRTRLLRGLVAGGAVLALLGGLFAAAAQRSDYFRVLFHLEPGQSLVDYVVQARAGARLALAVAGWRVFEEHPWLGVGLGGSGLYLYEALPEWSRTELRDIAYALSPEHRPVLNPKSMYPRLLAETGVVGFAAFVAFLLAFWARLEGLLAEPDAEARFVGWAGLWLLVAMLARWGSQDALSLPTFWLSAGVVLAYAAASRARGEGGRWGGEVGGR